MPKSANHLIHELSPYLLQHAYNPVEWFAWNESAFNKAKKENKPILVSIGYAACHWCHVMERESFEDKTTAAFMNKYFVNIKVDREERADVDHTYMQACQILTGSGGWPLNMFLTPELKPFTGGTYFPPKPNYGKPSWMDVLVYVHELFQKERDKVENQATMLLQHITQMNTAFTSLLKINSNEKNDIITNEEFAKIHENINLQFDKVYGGFGNAPKFPSSLVLKYILRKNYYEKNDAEIIHLHLSLYQMMYGGIYDQIGGGFARYSVDEKWVVPHFEKMLYDNALLVQLYAEAYMLFKDEEYKRIVIETLHFISNELTSDEGGFYCSLDADSEGEEGKYYTWTKNDIETILGEDADFFSNIFHISESGNWDGVNILYRSSTNLQNDFLNKLEESVIQRIEKCKSKLLQERSRRIKPTLDDKIILSWNALTASAYVAAYKATGIKQFKEIAERNLRFLLSKCRQNENEYAFHRTYKNGIAKYEAMLEDYAFLISALIDYYQVSADAYFLEKAIEINTYVINYFSDELETCFYFSHKKQTDLPLRNKEMYDHAIPSGNAGMFDNLQKIAIITGDQKFQERANRMLQQIKGNMMKYPTSFGHWLNGSLYYLFPILETAIVGENAIQLLEKISRIYYPNQFIMTESGIKATEYPLLQNRYADNATNIYNCRNYKCNNPVKSIEEYITDLKSF